MRFHTEVDMFALFQKAPIEQVFTVGDAFLAMEFEVINNFIAIEGMSEAFTSVVLVDDADLLIDSIEF